MLHEMGRYGDALASFDAALELDPEYSYIHGRKGA